MAPDESGEKLPPIIREQFIREIVNRSSPDPTDRAKPAPVHDAVDEHVQSLKDKEKTKTA